MNYHSLSEQVKHFSLAFFNAPENQYLPYHNLVHTEGVVKAAIQIGNHYQLDDHDFFIVLAAAWFHDMGYFSADPANHEKTGAEKAGIFLKDLDVDEQTITKVQECIRATRLPQSPANLLEQIVCDADMFHLGTDEFQERNKLMRKERETAFNNRVSKEDWRKGTINLFQTHQYHTEYCKLLLNKKKQENLEKLLEKQQDVSEKKSIVPLMEKEAETIAEKPKKKKEKEKDKR